MSEWDRVNVAFFLIDKAIVKHFRLRESIPSFKLMEATTS
jgi:hypothetical protein